MRRQAHICGIEYAHSDEDHPVFRYEVTIVNIAGEQDVLRYMLREPEADGLRRRLVALRSQRLITSAKVEKLSDDMDDIEELPEMLAGVFADADRRADLHRVWDYTD